MSNAIISVVVAIYNAEKYIERSVNSIVNQTYRELEIFLIDDGSTDSSGDICDEFAEKDSRIQVIHKRNEGLSVARNIAISKATGKYISFIDSDDELREDAYELAVGAMEENDLDIIKYQYCTNKSSLYSPTMLRVDREPIHNAVVKILKDEYGSQLWQYLFKLELWKEIISPPGRLAQDMMTLHLVAHKAIRFGIINQNLYYYFQNRQDNVSNGNRKKIKGTVDRAYAYWLRVDFCCANSDYSGQRDFCLGKAVEYTVSCFANKEFWTDERYKNDYRLFKEKIRFYNKEILGCRSLTASRKICAKLIVYAPGLLLKLKR